MNISLRDLIQAGVHFGHQTRRWNPKMRPFVYGAKNGIHIIDLQKTARGLIDATRFLQQSVAHGGSVLFVGTKRSAREIVAEEAARCGMFHINHRWLGGTLTNWQTVKKSIDRLLQLEHARDEGRFDLLTKKEALQLTREITKMEKNLGGIKKMKGLPSALFVVDPRKEHIAIREACTLGIPVVALCDTNCDPDGISYVIPGNDDALKSIRLFTAAIADAVIEGGHRATEVSAASYHSTVEGDSADVEIIRRPSTEVDGDAATEKAVGVVEAEQAPEAVEAAEAEQAPEAVEAAEAEQAPEGPAPKA
jgi:small subunit ribosomal protein S2